MGVKFVPLGTTAEKMSWFLQKIHSLMPVINTFGAVYNSSWGSTLPIFQAIPNQRGNDCAVVASQVEVALYQQKSVSYLDIYSCMMRIAQASDVWNVPLTNIFTNNVFKNQICTYLLV